MRLTKELIYDNKSETDPLNAALLVKGVGVMAEIKKNEWVFLLW